MVAMPIDADTVRQLAARGEGTTLDFKARDYDWSKKANNAELVKDLMAIGNVIHRGGGPGYILVGVQNDGNVVGIASHEDDAVLHQRVYSVLNRTPSFVYGAVAVDGLSVGVYQIHGGARPYYPLRDAPPLRKHVAVYRNGTSTEPASPDMILEWAREDDADAYRLRSLQLRRAEAEATIKGRVSPSGRPTSHAGDISVDMFVENLGRCGFHIERATCTFEWNKNFEAEMKKAKVTELPSNYTPFTAVLGSPPVGEYLPPNGRLAFSHQVLRVPAIRHVSDSIGVPGWNSSWANYHFELVCLGELGGTETLRACVVMG